MIGLYYYYTRPMHVHTFISFSWNHFLWKKTEKHFLCTYFSTNKEMIPLFFGKKADTDIFVEKH